VLEGFVNLTPFAAQPFLLSDERGADIITFVVKGTFSLRVRRETTHVALAAEQAPVCIAPKYHGEPGLSSLKYDTEVAPAKMGTDVVLVGHARPGLTRATYLDVTLSVGPTRSTVRVLGDRFWTSNAGRWVATPPQPFEAIPLVYERAFGGWDRSNPDPSRHGYEPRNPVGVGYVGKHGTVKEGAPLPNLENPHEPITGPTDRPAPLGFGYIGAHWQPRSQFAGTYDDRWEKERMPLLPRDFDRRFYNAAHPALAISGFLRGGEPVEVVNSSAQGTLRFALPAAQPYATMRMRDGTTQRAGMALDTVIVNTDDDQLLLVWRCSMPVPKRIYDVLWTKAQLAQPAPAQ
jgi:hypothetical protein